jgi:UDP-glucose-4-epimerase GalE
MSERETILVTGGAGFAGSHFARVAADAGRDVIVLDDLSGGPPANLPKSIPLIVGDISERHFVTHLLRERRVGAVVHFGGKNLIPDSVRDPATYFDVNVLRTLELLLAVRDAEVHSFILASTAAVYGSPAALPIPEAARREPVNPFGATKLAIELALHSWSTAYGLCWCALRHFNVGGAHPDGSLRESHEPETHLIPLAIDAGLGTGASLNVYGDNYETPDGTCIRDYIHVMDVAGAYMAALARLEAGTCLGALNLGTGRGHSVREVIEACTTLIGRRVPNTIAPRRPGDVPMLIADPTLAMAKLRWRPERSELTTIVEDALRTRRPASMARSRSA